MKIEYITTILQQLISGLLKKLNLNLIEKMISIYCNGVSEN